MLASDYNLPKTLNYIINSNNYKLHYRIYYSSISTSPSSSSSSFIDNNQENNIIGSLFWVHGFGGHSNRPEIQKMASYFNSKGYIVLCLDFQGHGYSEGERGLILSHNHLVNDLYLFINCILNNSNDNNLINIDESDKYIIQTIQLLPFFLMGQSMGGGVISLLSSKIQSFNNYIGSVILAPYLGAAKVPHWIVLNILRYTMVSCFPNSFMPNWLHDINDPHLTWKDEETIKFSELDSWGKPGAIGYNLPMRWGTAGMFIDMGIEIKNSLSDFNYPFLIIHDPDDQITSISGSRDMFNQSKTLHEDKQLIETPGYLHAILSNHCDEVCQIVLDWINKRLEKFQK